MKVVEIGYHCCIRLVKQAVALMPRQEVHCIGFQKPSCWELFTTFVLCHTVHQLQEAVKLHKDADIFHIHNEPTWLVIAVREVTDKPIILDVHDSMSYRTDEAKYKSVTEQYAFKNVDGIVFVSNSCQEITVAEHNITCPSIVLPSYVPRRFYKYRDWGWVGGVVYQGLVSTDKSQDIMQYANYKEFVEETVKYNIPFHIFTTKIDDYFKEYYKDAIIEGALPYGDLLSTLGHFDWGLCGNVRVFKDWQVALPNKVFEYLAGGIPIVAMNCAEVEKFVTETGVGISVKSVHELKERWGEKEECRENVFSKRLDFCMENHIHKLEEFYRCFL